MFSADYSLNGRVVFNLEIVTSDRDTGLQARFTEYLQRCDATVLAALNQEPIRLKLGDSVFQVASQVIVALISRNGWPVDDLMDEAARRSGA